MTAIYTIGFTKKTAEEFFTLLETNNIDEVIDVRLNNSSQICGFAKFPDIEYFLQKICDISYWHDLEFAPSKKLFDAYKANLIDWEDYEKEFAKLMSERNILNYIKKNIPAERNFCLLCAESSPENCHRRLVAEKFAEVFGAEIIHL